LWAIKKTGFFDPSIFYEGWTQKEAIGLPAATLEWRRIDLPA
jgi:hypothetical protein